MARSGRHAAQVLVHAAEEGPPTGYLAGELLDAGQGARWPLLERGVEPLGHGRVQVVEGGQPPPGDLRELALVAAISG